MFVLGLDPVMAVTVGFAPRLLNDDPAGLKPVLMPAQAGGTDKFFIPGSIQVFSFFVRTGLSFPSWAAVCLAFSRRVVSEMVSTFDQVRLPDWSNN